MIIKKIDDNAVALIPEESDDLFTLRRIISKGDRVTGDTSRAVKQEKDFSRPDKGERVRIRIALDVEKISIDEVVDRLRVQGTIEESDNPSVSKGSHHSLTLKIGDAVTLVKKSWSDIEQKLIFGKKDTSTFLLAAIDTTDCGLGRLSGTHLKLLPNMYSGASGKRYKSKFNIQDFFKDVQSAISTLLRDGDSIVIFGPGETKKRLANFLSEVPSIKVHKIQVVDGIDSSGEDGIYTFIKSEIMKQTLDTSKIAKVSAILDETMARANKKSNKFTMGFEETAKANEIGAVESLVFSDKIFEKQDEDKIIEFLNHVESKGVEVYAVDSTTDAGLRVSSLGGVISLLRFAPQS
ncbi:Protein pelota homolog [Nitrosotalea devaniterrae]|uniref:Protein pelota homolog n=1 Tax=Nitrosotalea devaniterrae TaxID=1078905 RepID=A0A128A0R8_9ARCH|nr:Protein pelota homolog [Candidatus Nitrosotalea devanaterra]